MLAPQIFILKVMGVLPLQDQQPRNVCKSVLQILLSGISAISFVSQVGHFCVLIELVVLGVPNLEGSTQSKNCIMWLLDMAPCVATMFRSMAVLVIFRLKRTAWCELFELTHELEGSNTETEATQQVSTLAEQAIYTLVLLYC